MTPNLPADQRGLVAIDLGAESCRVSLLRWCNGAPHILLVHRFANSPIHAEGRLFWDIHRIEAGIDHGLRLCAELAPQGIRSVAVDGWAVDYVRLDSSGAALANPFCYRDERTVAAEASVHQRLSASEMRAITGMQLMRINTIYQMAADEAPLRAARWLNLPEYILHRLGGRMVSELTNATHTQMVDCTTRTWSLPILHALQFDPSSFPPIVAPGTDIGPLRGPLTHHPAFRDTRLIAPACHDTASAIGGIPDAGDDWAYISAGTWSLVGTLLDRPVNHTAACTANFTNLAAAGGKVCFHKNVNGMWLLRQCMEHWAHEQTFTVPQLIEMAEASGPPAYLLDVDDSNLLLAGAMPERINEQLRRRGLHEFPAGITDAAAITSLLFHSLAERYAQVLRTTEAITRKKLKRVYIVGGGSRNTLLTRLTAEATGLEVVPGSAESTTLGNLAIQLASLESGCEPEHISQRAIQRWAHILMKTEIATLP
jgi:rhamnulokinase